MVLFLVSGFKLTTIGIDRDQIQTGKLARSFTEINDRALNKITPLPMGLDGRSACYHGIMAGSVCMGIHGLLLSAYPSIIARGYSALSSDQECVLTGQGLPDLGYVLCSAISIGPSIA